MPDVAGLYRRFGVKLPEIEDGWGSTRCFSGRHRDRHPSARVHLRSGGFRCFTCGARGGVLDALQLLGVYDRDEARQFAVEYGILDPPHRPRRPVTVKAAAPTTIAPPQPATAGLGGHVDYDNLPDKPEVVLERAWVYMDEHNRPVGRVRRLDLADGSKRIYQERPDGDSFTPGLNGARLPLYRLPEVLEHGRQGSRVLIVEGEKACDALDRLGFFATTNPGGAGKWRDEHTAALGGAIVLTIGDCDLPGREHAIQVSLDLNAHNVKVLSPLDLDPERMDGFDIVDHLAGVADTIRAVTPGLSNSGIRARLHDHLQSLLTRPHANGGSLQRDLEHVRYRANPAGHAYLNCPRCEQGRVHRVTSGIAFCPCGAHQIALV